MRPASSPTTNRRHTRDRRYGRRSRRGQHRDHPPSAPPRHPATLGYRPELDGLRALAVLAVLAYHARFAWAVGGFLGVSAFFTLSGFLVTTLLLERAAATGSVDLRAFWAKRFRRLLPAAWCTLLAIVAIGLGGWWKPNQLTALRADVPTALAGVFNWHLVLAGRSYGADFAAPSPVEHFWSLSVEQQFYVGFPLLVAAALAAGRRWPRRTATGGQAHNLLPLAAGAAVLTGASATVAWWWARTDPYRAYLSTLSRLAELFVGVLLAVALTGRHRLRNRALRGAAAFGGLAALPATIWLWHTAHVRDPWLYPWGLLTSAALTAILIASSLQPGPLQRLLAAPPLVRLGAISYGVYLVHWPVFLLLSPAKVHWSPTTLFASRLAISIVLAAALDRAVERPLRRPATLRRTWAPVAVAASVALAATAVAVGRGEPSPASAFTSAAQRPAAPDALAAGQPNHAGQPNRASEPDRLDQADPATAPPPPPPLRVLAIGDELAASAPSLAVASGTLATEITAEAAPGCGLATGGWVRLASGAVERDVDRCGDVAAQRSARMQRDRPEVVALWAGLRDLADRHLDASTPWAAPGDRVLDEFLAAEIGAAIDDAIATGASVVVLGAPPMHDAISLTPAPPRLSMDPARQATIAKEDEIMAKHAPPPGAAENDPARTTRWNQLLATAASSRHVPFVDVAAHVAAWPGGPFDPARRAADGIGWSTTGAADLGPWLAEQLHRASAPAAAAPLAAAASAASVPAIALQIAEPPPAPPTLPRRIVPRGRRPTVLVAGDSVAWNYFESLAAHAATGPTAVRAVDGSVRGCPFARGGSRRFMRDIGFFGKECDWSTFLPSLLETQRPDVVLVCPGVWDVVDRRFPGDDRWRHIGTPEVDSYVVRELVAVIDLAASTGATVVLTTSPHVQIGLDQGYTDLPESDPARIDRLNELVRKAAQLRPAVTKVLDVRGWLASLPGGELDPAKRDDGIHPAAAFRPQLAAWLAAQLVPVARG